MSDLKYLYPKEVRSISRCFTGLCRFLVDKNSVALSLLSGHGIGGLKIESLLREKS